jgi:HSP20 family molecular chaperone IbpA
MAAMRMVGNGRQLPPHAHVTETPEEYVIELDVSDFTQPELTAELIGSELTVRGDQLEDETDQGLAFRLHERLEESFRLPADADVDALKVFYAHGSLEIHAPKKRLVPRAVPIERKPVHLINPEAAAC